MSKAPQPQAQVAFLGDEHVHLLDIETSITDAVLETRDDTDYIVHLYNRSKYLVADNIQVTVALSKQSQSEAVALRDEHVTIEIIPPARQVRCLEPGKPLDLHFKIITRWTAPKLYVLDISVKYDVVYYEKLSADERTTQHVLPVQGGDFYVDPKTIKKGARLPRQPTFQTERSNSMTDIVFPPTAKPRQLLPVCIRHPLPRGFLEISYRLTKGPRPDPDRWPHSYGLNPDTNQAESYFSSEDQACIELTLRNASDHTLKHIHFTDIRLAEVNNDGSVGEPATRQLRDGNLEFEIVPQDTYYGGLLPQEHQTKYLSLITRGVKPGRYVVLTDLNYDIEQWTTPIALGLAVRPD
jgi:hypothetical protein